MSTHIISIHYKPERQAESTGVAAAASTGTASDALQKGQYKCQLISHN